MGIGESLKEKKGCVFFFILFRFADTISSEKELKGLNLSCPHFPFMSYTYSSSIGIFFFLENKKKRKEREMSSFLSALESRDVGDWAFLSLFLSITFPPFFGLCCLKMLNWFDSFWFRWFRWPEFNGFFLDWPDEPPKNKQRTDGMKK
jgi:hypothetical protein